MVITWERFVLGNKSELKVLASRPFANFRNSRSLAPREVLRYHNSMAAERGMTVVFGSS